ncbi:MAG: hypothetical protein Q7T26_04475 [Dehalococcoidia bacterium]|nr:hypothetical protein [Dehalococcoidia bacterium]
MATPPIKLRPYQVEVGRAVLGSVARRRGLTFTVEMARQAGKNELSAHMEVLLLVMHALKGGTLVKCAPTFVPQVVVSMRRLRDRLDDAGLRGLWSAEAGHAVRLGKARALFFSAEPGSHVVGATADVLLEVDEAQDVDKQKFARDFRPMGAPANVTTVLYGTAWDGSTLLEESKQVNLEMERRDGVKRHFRFDWLEVGRHNPDYMRYVEGERARLGESHPLFQTQYCLNPVRGAGGFLSAGQRAQLQGAHSRQRSPRAGAVYVAGIDIAGEAEAAQEGPNQDAAVRAAERRRDSTVVSIGEVDFAACTDALPEPRVRVVEHYWWTGRPHAALYAQLVDVLRDVWRCRRVVVDATGVGAGVASFLAKALSGIVTPFVFTAPGKSRIGFQLLAAVNAGRLKMYGADGSAEWRSSGVR